MDIEFQLSDTFDAIRPKMKRFATVEEANKAISEVERVEREKAKGAT
jgi:hypothetical protein